MKKYNNKKENIQNKHLYKKEKDKNGKIKKE